MGDWGRLEADQSWDNLLTAIKPRQLIGLSVPITSKE
jgi:hypothetical protein